ncbi:hypothetical protein V5O48_004716 [Marasmius crinis-equi]|uniref:F-box domain-containing protein n=1 Tax=Marasmius crinis-equi TaxID=585013 RepID=A0ABR3FPA7_9AGAR
MPMVWAKISVTLQLNDTPYPFGILQRLKHCISRSRNSLIDLEVRCTRKIFDGLAGSSPARQIMGALLEQAHRWRSLTYIQAQGGRDEHYTLLEELDDYHTPCLRFLHVTLDHTVHVDDPELPPIPLDVLSNVDELQLSGREPRLLPVELFEDLQSSQITHLHLEVFSNVALQLLTSCPQLISAHFGIAHDPSADQASPAPSPRCAYILWLSLENTRTSGFDEVTKFLGRITCPCIDSLIISYHPAPCASAPNPNPPNFPDAFKTFLERSDQRLRTFRSDGLPISDRDLVSILRNMCCLHTLEVIDSDSAENEKTALTSHTIRELSLWPRTSTDSYPRTASLVPELREIRLTVDKDWDDNAFESFLRSRAEWNLESAFLRVRSGVKGLDLVQLERVNNSKGPGELAVRVIEGEEGKEKEVVGYWAAPVVGLRKHGWRGLVEGNVR